MSRTTVLAYRRRSVVKTKMDEISPARQTRAVEALVDPRDWTCEWYEDVDGHSSGRTEEGRPGWLALRSQLDRPDVVGIAAYSLSRISRSVTDFLQILDDLERRGLALITCKESIDTSNAVGRAVRVVRQGTNPDSVGHKSRATTCEAGANGLRSTSLKPPQAARERYWERR
jgi:DNA invertase Pin-like site-specific DNA recombinase